MATQCKEPSKTVNILIAQDISPESHLAREIVECLRNRQNIKTTTLTWSRDSQWTTYDWEGRRNKPIPSDELVEWADLLVVAGIAAGTLSKMLQGDTQGFLLEILRSWDVSKKILMVPEMTFAMWENPMTKKHINKIRRKWNWIRILEPILRRGKDSLSRVSEGWLGMEELIQEVLGQADLMSLGHDLEMIPGNVQQSAIHAPPNHTRLPKEIWSLILEYVADWEVATSLGIYTRLPVPLEWTMHHAKAPINLVDVHRTSDLEWTILVGSYQQVTAWFKLHPTPKWLSKLCVKVIIKFARTDLLSYLESNQKDPFWSTFGHTLLPTKASAVFGKVAILDWWRTSPSFLTKEYNTEALDTASKAGFINILDWWRSSGLPLRYTEAALEQASSRGNLDVLEWWRSASLPQANEVDTDKDHESPATPALYGNEPEDSMTKVNSAMSNSMYPLPLRLKVGKSIIYAAQNGQTAALKWWINSNIPTAHEEAVARIASANGHVNVLQLWKECKGEKMQYDNQVLVGPTKNGHVEVLEWWKQSRYTVEYKTCDIEEALEDSLSGSGEDRIRAWWARNGLNLGVGTSEWMKIKVL